MSGNLDLITAQDLAKALNLSVETIWKYTRENKIPFIDLGNRQYRYRLLEVLGALAGSVRENAQEYKIDPSKKYTYQDYLELPEEPGYRYEILEGLLIREPSPNVNHQRVSRSLQRVLEDYFAATDPEGEVFNAPLDVTFFDTTVVQPDIFYITGKQKELVQETRIDGPPALVVEVLSPSTSRKDRLKKLHIYQKVQVQHYWIVNPEEKTLECFALREGNYALVASGVDDEVVEHPDFPGLSVDLQALWAKTHSKKATVK